MKITIDLDTAKAPGDHDPEAVVRNAIAGLERYTAHVPEHVTYIIRNDNGVPIGSLSIDR